MCRDFRRHAKIRGVVLEKGFVAGGALQIHLLLRVGITLPPTVMPASAPEGLAEDAIPPHRHPQAEAPPMAATARPEAAAPRPSSPAIRTRRSARRGVAL